MIGCASLIGLEPPGDVDEPADGSVADNPIPLARYYLDDGASSSFPTQIIDSAASQAHLAPEFNGQNPFVKIDGRWGICWTRSAGIERAALSVAESSAWAELNGATAMTFELVVDVTEINSQRSRYFQIGALDDAGRGALALASNNEARLQLYWQDLHVADWSVNLVEQPRVVLHVVIDTSRSVASERSQLYLNNQKIDPQATDQEIELDQGLLIGESSDIVALGNHPANNRSLRGTIFYFAAYLKALSAAERASAVDSLSMGDDSADFSGVPAEAPPAECSTPGSST